MTRICRTGRDTTTHLIKHEQTEWILFLYLRQFPLCYLLKDMQAIDFYWPPTTIHNNEVTIESVSHSANHVVGHRLNHEIKQLLRSVIVNFYCRCLSGWVGVKTISCPFSSLHLISASSSDDSAKLAQNWIKILSPEVHTTNIDTVAVRKAITFYGCAATHANHPWIGRQPKQLLCVTIWNVCNTCLIYLESLNRIGHFREQSVDIAQRVDNEHMQRLKSVNVNCCPSFS